MTQNLTASMVQAWLARAEQAAAFLNHANTAPALFKPDAVEQARRDYVKAMNEAARWSA